MKGGVPEEGDIFRWRWTPEEYSNRYKQCGSTIYWCKSQIAICKNGRLIDNYWYDGSDSAYVLDMDRVEITFLGNPASMKRISGHDRVFYKPEDVVDTSHANSSSAPIYVKGERDPDTMREYYRYQAERWEREERKAQDRMAACRSAIAAIDRGERDDSYFPIYR